MLIFMISASTIDAHAAAKLSRIAAHHVTSFVPARIAHNVGTLCAFMHVALCAPCTHVPTTLLLAAHDHITHEDIAVTQQALQQGGLAQVRCRHGVCL